MTPQEISIFLYNLALIPVLAFSILFFILAITNFFNSSSKHKKKSSYPLVTVQIPSYNDPIAARCVEACLAFTYPKNRYQIMILDDSTDLKTQKLLKSYATNKNVTYIHRNNRDGYKPGALNDAMRKVTGEIVVIFDADFQPRKDYLELITTPFSDPKVAIVQSRQGFNNKDTNLISRFAAYLLMIHHTIHMPINNKINSVLFCGTAGAIRKSALLGVGGWNSKSITEDTELSVRIISNKWKTVYLDFETPSEVPVTLEGFIKQQMRWCFGNVRVFLDNWRTLIYRKGLTIPQRLMITYLTLGNIIAPAVIIMTITGASGWFLGELHIFTFSELTKFFITIFYTAGFFTLGAVTLYRHGKLVELPHLIAAAFTISLVLAAANSIALFKAVFRKNEPLFPSNQTSWIRTQKEGNAAYWK